MEQIHSFHSDGYVGSSLAASPHCNFNTLRQSRRKQGITMVHRKVLGKHMEIIIPANYAHESYPGHKHTKGLIRVNLLCLATPCLAFKKLSNLSQLLLLFFFFFFPQSETEA